SAKTLGFLSVGHGRQLVFGGPQMLCQQPANARSSGSAAMASVRSGRDLHTTAGMRKTWLFVRPVGVPLLTSSSGALAPGMPGDKRFVSVPTIAAAPTT